MKATALFRCDANAGSGLGHLSRSIALAEALRELAWNCVFAGCYSDRACALIKAAELQSISLSAEAGAAGDIDATAHAAHQSGATAIVVDSYRIGPEYADRLRSPERRLVAIDDFGGWQQSSVDLVLNFTIDAKDLAYRPAKTLLGPGFFLARANLRRRRIEKDVPAVCDYRTLIALSGDADGARTLSLASALADLGVSVRFVVASDARAREDLAKLAHRMPAGSDVRLSPSDLAEDLWWADVVLCTGGMIKYEAHYLGCIVLTAANTDYEGRDTARWSELGLGIDLGPLADLKTGQAAAAMRGLLDRPAAQNAAMRSRSRALFPDDPTRAAAEAITRALIG